MNWIKIKEFDDCDGIPLESNSELLSKGLLVFCDSNSIVQIYETNSYKKVDFKNGIDYNIRVLNDNFYFTNGKSLFSLSNDLKSYSAVYEAKEENLYLISEIFCKDFTSKRSPRTFINCIVDLRSKESIYYWEDDKNLLFELDNNFYFQTKFKGNLFTVDIKTNNIIWEIEIDKGISGKRYFQELPNDECLIQKYIELNINNLLNLNLKTGQIKWEIENSLSFYNYDEKSKKLFGLGYKPGDCISSSFEIINVYTGERVMKKELDLQVPAHLTFYADGYLYFSGFKGDNTTRIFGAVDVNTGEIVFTQSIETSNGETYRGSYDRPVVVNNRLYIRDQQKTLHIYERQDA